MKRFFSLIFLLVSAPLWAQAPGVLSLQEAYQLALKQSETVAISDETIRIAEAHYLQALGTVLPHLNAKASELIQDTTETFDTSGSSVGGTLTRRSRPEVSIGLSQPLFQGLREFKALGMSGAEKRKNIYQTERTHQLLFADVTKAYYTVLELESDREILKSQKKTLASRTSELRERIRLGKSRESEDLSLQSQTATLEAEIEKTEGLVETARDYLAFLVGREVTEALEDQFTVPASVKPVESWLAALQNRPDLNANTESVHLSKGKVDWEKGGRLPRVDLNANYYPYRVGFLQDIKWDVLFTFNLPIFQGGATRGSIREAEANLRQSEFRKKQASRQAELDVRQAYHRFIHSQLQSTALSQAAAKAGSNYEAQKQEYRLGLVNNLEVLQILNDWLDRQRSANQARYQTKLRYLQLRLATGDLPQ